MKYQVKFWRSNPQIRNGGYETIINIEAKTKKQLEKKIREWENGSNYFGRGMSFMEIVGQE